MGLLDSLYNAGSPYGDFGMGDTISKLLKKAGDYLSDTPSYRRMRGYPGGMYDTPPWALSAPQQAPGGAQAAPAPEAPQAPQAPALPPGVTVGASPGSALPQDPRSLDQIAYGGPQAAPQGAPAAPLPLQPPAPAAAPAAPAGLPSPASGGIGERAMNAFQSWAHTPMGNPMLGIANLVGSISSGQRTDKAGVALQHQAMNMRAIYSALRSQGMDSQRAAAMAEIASRNPKVAEELFKPPANMEAAIARNYGGVGALPGASVAAGAPAGSPPAPGSLIPQQQPQTPMQAYSNLLSMKKEAETRGKAIAEAKMSMPKDTQDAKAVFSVITQLKNHKGLPQIIGPFAGRLPAIGGDQAAALALHHQLEGKLFMQAYATLKGGGQITEIEGEKATQALARLSRVQDEGDYKAALDEFVMHVKRGLNAKADFLGQARPFPDVATAVTPQEAETGTGVVDYTHYTRTR